MRVIAPEALALEICDTLDEARAAYSRRLQFPMLRMAMPAVAGATALVSNAK